MDSGEILLKYFIFYVVKKENEINKDVQKKENMANFWKDS